jgi:membrane protease subunit (stomatin/prohibitin family)
MLDQRISMNMLGDMGKYTQFQVAQSLPIAAANEGGGGVAGIGVGLGAGLTMANSMINAMKPGQTTPGEQPPPADGLTPGAGPVAPAGPAAPATETKFCTNCGNKIPRGSKFCPECGTAQQ